MKELERACNTALRSLLSPTLVGSIRRLLENGVPPDKVMEHCCNAGATRGTMTVLAIVAEIEAILAEMAARRN
jgi:hypothetical protein